MARVVLYELNEVPWSLIDHYVAQRPASNLAEFVGQAASATTVCSDTVPLQPWRTWPSFHRSMYTEEHRSVDLGQDPTTFQGDDVWDVAARAGKRVGVFGPMQSWPAKEYASGGFYVPDTFARSAETVPASIGRFQQFNLAMTAENSFSSDSKLSPVKLAATGADIALRGLTARSVGTLAQHLVKERKDARNKAGRSMMQVVPSFDLFWRLQRRTHPDLGVFFTNHVAGMMHRYWGDGVPGYQSEYERDPVFSGFVMTALDLFDSHLGRMRRYAARNPDVHLVVASSMGQGPITYRPVSETYVVADPKLLATRLGLGSVEVGLAMYPRTSLQFETGVAAAAAVDPIGALRTGDEPLFTDVRVEGLTVSFDVSLELLFGEGALPREVQLAAHGSAVPIEELGLMTRTRLGGGNTAYHIPQGILLVEGPGYRGGSTERAEVDLLDVAPLLLRLIGVERGASMRGEADRCHVALTATSTSAA